MQHPPPDDTQATGGTGGGGGGGEAGEAGLEVFASDRPNAARMYDYWLGGKDNTEADRAAADQLTAVTPNLPALARANRAFLVRAVEHLAAEHGIRQFVDFGSGLPTRRNVHQVAQEIDPDARVVYVDHDPIVTRHAYRLLAREGVGDRVKVLRYDVREMSQVVGDAGFRAVIDPGEPTGVLMVAVLHFVDAPAESFHEQIFRPLARVLAPGSLLAFSYGVVEEHEGQVEQVHAAYRGGSSGVGPMRGPREVEELIPPPWRLLPPGLATVEGWRGIGEPDPLLAGRDRSLWGAAGVARLDPADPPGPPGGGGEAAR